MSNEVLLKTRSAITAQAGQGSAISANSYSSGTQTVIDNTIDGGSENSQGACELELFLEMTISASDTTTYARVYMESSYDGTNYSEKTLVLTSPALDSSSTSDYFLGTICSPPPYCRFSIYAYSGTFDAKLIVVPKLFEVQ